ncbi:hypothetical protein [Caulobacter sp. LjRoot300]|uniref:hypothetical protein n=1 Tax=Caulobacter sp. LjRoot300 TaxID=3342321 RepID=UPI003ECC34DC
MAMIAGMAPIALGLGAVEAWLVTHRLTGRRPGEFDELGLEPEFPEIAHSPAIALEAY